MRLFEAIYYSGYRAKTAFDLRRMKRLPARVISVGNITSGGTGKTPMTLALAREAVGRGLRPVVLTRGYKGRARGPCLVQGRMRAEDVGDEPLLMAERLGGVPVVKCADRYEGGIFALEHAGQLSAGGGGESEPPPIFILDDGFQHRRLYRDRDILLIDAQNPFDNRKLLPVGLLREPICEISRAHLVVITKGMGLDVSALEGEIRKHNPAAPVFVSGHRPSGIVTPSGETFPLEWLSGRHVYAFAGIADPDSFRIALFRAGAEIAGFMSYRDHHRFRPDDIEHITRFARASGAEWIMTTEKDIMRLKGFELPENLAALSIELDIEGRFFDEVFKF
ncbi:MAG: tetraacyldisaccharide 4'-kinase [Thermodesulfovibrionales bacterium]